MPPGWPHVSSNQATEVVCLHQRAGALTLQRRHCLVWIGLLSTAKGLLRIMNGFSIKSCMNNQFSDEMLRTFLSYHSTELVLYNVNQMYCMKV